MASSIFKMPPCGGWRSCRVISHSGIAVAGRRSLRQSGPVPCSGKEHLEIKESETVEKSEKSVTENATEEISSERQRRRSVTTSSDGGESDQASTSPSGEVVIYGTAVVLTLGICSAWLLFRDPIEDFIYGGDLFTLFERPISLGDVTSLILWSVAYYYVSPLQILFAFLGRFEAERPSDWLINKLGDLLGERVDEAQYTPSMAVYSLALASVIGLGLVTVAILDGIGEGATWSVSTGIGACMAAGIFEVGRPSRLSVSETQNRADQYLDFAQFAETRLVKSGACHESDIYKAFRIESGYRDEDVLSDSRLRGFVKEWAPRSKRSANGFMKGVSTRPRVDPFRSS